MPFLRSNKPLTTVLSFFLPLVALNKHKPSLSCSTAVNLLIFLFSLGFGFVWPLSESRKNNYYNSHDNILIPFIYYPFKPQQVIKDKLLLIASYVWYTIRVLPRILVQKGGKFALIYIFLLISITIEKVQNEVMVNMPIKKDNLQMDGAKVKLIACMNWIEIETWFIFFPIPSHFIIYGS